MLLISVTKKPLSDSTFLVVQFHSMSALARFKESRAVAHTAAGVSPDDTQSQSELPGSHLTHPPSTPPNCSSPAAVPLFHPSPSTPTRTSRSSNRHSQESLVDSPRTTREIRKHVARVCHENGLPAHALDQYMEVSYFIFVSFITQ